ncbi:response regulator [Hydrogenophaga aromaticivorans]|uniref:response regulator transcription factor n=1 Tax=Hydrogenophaga aromaticivorans TaxID=2610898 RepID=UPI001B35EFC2|nr:DNA-binding response regulator [Hydrogenophaga aromaticivorans]MBQ0918859.1 response regulator [Hydrogenophaga aromaticivorans]
MNPLPTETLPPAHTPTQPVILVVDDAPETLRMLCDALVLEGYDVLAARDTLEALERFEVTVPDGVLLDAVMPGRDGFDLCAQIKSTPAWSHVPVLFMTGLSETDQIIRGFACGGVDYVVKPLRVPEVMARLATHVRNARVARLAREAVDVAGMGTVLLDSQGRMAWRSPQAADWLAQAFGANEAAQTTAAQWLGRARDDGEAHTPAGNNARLVARHMGQGGPGESMLLLTQTQADNAALQRLRNVALTPRETEVLSWLAKGKTNRDIADILGMSHRTVNKHLEHVFEKLGVETRSAAAAIAGRLLPQD